MQESNRKQFLTLPERQVQISKDMLDYLRKAEQYAIQHGFKATIFDERAKPIALQG